MNRRLSWLLIRLLVVAFIGVTTSWIRSHFVVDNLQIGGPTRAFLTSCNGRLDFTFVYVDAHDSDQVPTSGFVALLHWPSATTAAALEDAATNGDRFSLHAGAFILKWFVRASANGSTPGWEGPGFEVRLPYWFVLASVALLLGWAVRRRTLRQLNALGCSTCGYDLRATPNRCPECGRATEINAPARSPAAQAGRQL